MPVVHCCPPSQQARTVSHDVGRRYLCQLQRRHGEAGPRKMVSPQEGNVEAVFGAVHLQERFSLGRHKGKMFQGLLGGETALPPRHSTLGIL